MKVLSLKAIIIVIAIICICISNSVTAQPGVCGQCTDECYLVNNGYGFPGNTCGGPTGPNIGYEDAVDSCLAANNCNVVPINYNIWLLGVLGLSLGLYFVFKNKVKLVA
ncbi:MAG: hypothetical protein SFY32_14545 [Bacteroidota bacterium]|nr:hypothetical protein [Bacteroidota bacterium]